MTTTPTGHEAPSLPDDLDGGTCPRCDTPFDRYQEYCLECGLRLPLGRGMVSRLHTAWTRRLPWYPGDWIWPALLFLGLAVLGATIAILWAADNQGTQRLVGTTNLGTEVTTLPVETIDTGPIPPATVVTPPPPTSSTPPAVTVPEQPPPGALREWPASRRNGYTVVLVSLPATGGRAQATKKAKEASKAGLTDVGVIDSGNFSSLHPGYFVIFAGVHDTLGEAQDAVSAARSAGFSGAYPRQITR